MERLVIEARGLGRTFPARRRGGQAVEALRDLTLGVGAGERVAFVGPNGAGKSTAIKLLTGVLHPTSGTAEVLGLVPWRRRRALARRIGTLFGQRSQLWFELTARQGLTLLAAVYDLTRDAARARVEELGGLLAIGEELDAPVRTLSLGQRMRCELAASLLHRPEVLFLDEPTIGLDLLAKQRFRELLITINAEQGTTVFLTSHDVADIEHVARRVVVINHGRLVIDDEVGALRRRMQATKLVEVGFTGAAGAVEVPGVTVVERGARRLKLAVDTDRRSIREALGAVLGAGEVADITVLDPPLETVLAEVYQTPDAAP
jgi:ABC-2 type transport system ATP-binding protein